MTTAIVFSGGGSRGSYQAGILKYLTFEKKISFDAAYGTSSGALNAFGYSYLGASGLVEMWQSISRIEDVFKPLGIAALWRKGFYDASPLRERVLKVATTHSPRIPVTVSKVNLDTGGVTFARSDGAGGGEHIADAVIASASIPGVVEPSYDVWVDGGVRSVAPLKPAIADGHDDIYVVLASPPYVDTWQGQTGLVRLFGVDLFRSALIAYRCIELMLNQILINDIRECLLRNKIEGFRKVSLRVFGPPNALWSPYDFSTTRRGASLGYAHHSQYPLETFSSLEA